MNIGKFVSTLLPSFEKAKLKEDIGLLREELKDTVLPVYKNAAKEMKKRKFASKQIEDFDNDFVRSVKTPFRGNFIEVTYQALENTYKNLDMVESLAEHYFADDIYRDAMTYLKVNIIQYVQAISFSSKFARSVLLWTYESEINAVERNADRMGKELTEGERKKLVDNTSHFHKTITIISKPKKEIEKKFADIPDVVATDDNYKYLQKTIGLTKLDPFMFGLIPVVLNPIYHVRMAIAEWQVNRHKASVEEKRMLEFRLLQLKQAEEGKKDARLEQQIEYTEARIQKLNYKILKMEENYG